MRLGVALAGARMVGRVDGKIARQRVMKLGPLRAPSAVQKNQRWPRARDFYVRLYLVIPNVDGAFLCSGHGLYASVTEFSADIRPAPTVRAGAGGTHDVSNMRRQ